MNWARVEGNWKEFTGKIKQQWGKLTDDQFEVMADKRDQLGGEIQETYRISKKEAKRHLADWQHRQPMM